MTLKRPFYLLIVLLSLLIAVPGYCDSKDEDEYIPLTDSMLFNAMRAAKGPDLDVRLEIVKNLFKVKNGRMSPEKFYREVAKMGMPPGKELRHVLMEVKKDVGNWKGEKGLRFVFGDIYASGATVVESTILTYRRKLVMETIKESIKEFKKTHPELVKTFTFYYGEVGGWPNESFDELKFAGDIDFNFLSGNLEAAMILKKIFDQKIQKKFKRTPEELDIPCTVHGMATAEVYVGKHGQAFAEAVTKHAWLIDFDSDLDGLGKDSTKTPFQEVLTKMVGEAKMKGVMNGLDNLGELKWPNQPGISLEMIRHFEHDIVGQNVYTDLESFVKAAKYADRSFTFLEEDLGEAAIKNKTLRQFTHDLVEAKKNPKKLMELIEDYYKAIGEPLPMEANFDITEGGKSKATIEMNEKLIREFWDVCRKTMWESANVKIRKVIDDMKSKIADLGENDGEKAKEIYDELKKYHEMLEIENKILTDKKAGLHEHLDDTFVKLIAEFRGTVKGFKEKIAKNDLLKYIDPEASKAFKWVEEMLKGESARMNIKMAWAGIDAVVTKTNDILDYFDDSLMQKLRYGDQGSYVKFLRNGQDYTWGEQAQQFLGSKIKLSTDYSAALDRAQTNIGEIRAELTKSLNIDLEQMCNTRGIKLIKTVGGGALGTVQNINNSFNRSVADSTAGGMMMKTMMIYNLKDEIPLYMNLVYEGDLDGLAAEFFRRRVPFGGAVERGIMGDYYGVAWELTATLLPPAAIVSAAKNIGESIAMSGIDAYFDEEFEKFIDNLYEDATFKILSVEQIGQDIKVTDWALLSVSYQGKEFDYDKLIALEIADAREMAECLQRPSRKRPDCFPMEKMSNGLFEWWGSRDAFETKFKKTDPWIQLIKEMEEHPSAGPKLQDHYRYQKYTRLEQIKVDFVKKLKTQLEERRAGEEALISGQFTQMYERLLAIADELDIRLQLENTIYEEFGNGVVQFMTWLKDYVRGEIRAIQGEADVWDVYEQLSAFVTKNLKVYNDVIEARADAESNLMQITDQGLRILTGPYFLSGKSDEDRSAAKEWKDVPEDVYDKTVKELQSIKKDSDADPSKLDLTAGAYDKSILDQILYHDTFRAMWKQVNSTFVNIQKSAYFVGSDSEVEGVESYLGNEPSTQTQPNRRGMSDQDRAMKRFKLHAERTAQLIEEFKEHYKKTAENEEQDTRQAEDETEAAVGALDGLLEQAEALYAQADAQFEALEDQADKLDDTTKEYEDQVEDMIEKINSEISAFHAASTVDLTQLIGKMQDASERLARARDDIELATLNVCESYERMKNVSSVRDADALLKTTRTGMERVRQLYDDARVAISDMNYYKSQAEQATNKFRNAQALIGQAKTLAARADTLHAQAESLVGQIDGLKEFIGKADSIIAQADEIFNKADTDESLSKDHKKALRALSKTYKKIIGRANKVKDVVNDGEGLKGDLNYVLFNAKAFAENLNVSIDQLEKLAGAEASARDEALKADVMSHYEAGMLFADPVNTANGQAKTCMDGVEREHSGYATPARREAQHDCSQWPGSVAKWYANENRVKCVCRTGTVWDDYTKTCMTRDAIVADTNCSKYGANAEAYWNHTQNTAWCRCKAGYDMINNYCVQRRQQPAYDPYYDDGYDDYNSGYGGGSDYGADDFVNDVTNILETIQGGKTNSGSGYNSGGGYNNSGYGSDSSGCERNFTMTYSGGAYGSQGFKCNCPGWGFDPSRSRCVQGMDDRYDTTPKQQPKPTGITTNKSRSTYQKPNTSSGTSSGGSSSGGTYSGGGYVDCSQMPDVCMWTGGSNLLGIPGAGNCVPVYCKCGCDTAPDYRCADMPKPQVDCY